MSNERRKTTRTNVSFPIECNVLPKREYFYTVSKDLSLSGARILSSAFLQRENEIKLNINCIEKIVDVKAKVVWCNKERLADRYSAGLEFIEIGEENKKYLHSIIG